MNTWKQAWASVNRRPRSNLGLIVDAFNSLAREYADPYTSSGLQRSASASSVFLKRHLAELRTTVPGNKIFLFQIADAGLPPAGSPLSIPPSPESGIPRLQQWSRNCRLFPLETSRGAYLPVTQYARAVLATGYAGDLSLEVFNASLHFTDADVPRQHAVRGFESLKRMSAALNPAEGEPSILSGTHGIHGNIHFLQSFPNQQHRHQKQRTQISCRRQSSRLPSHLLYRRHAYSACL